MANSCKDKNSALMILSTITETMKPGVVKDALMAVHSWVQTAVFNDLSKLTPEERAIFGKQLETEIRDLMSDDERRETAVFYLEGLKNAS